MFLVKEIDFYLENVYNKQQSKETKRILKVLHFKKRGDFYVS